MNIHQQIALLRQELENQFFALDACFNMELGIRDFQPQLGGWTIHLILEHVFLTNKFLLILVDKARRKALRNTQGRILEAELENYSLVNEQLKEVGIHKYFEWVRPEHMEPKGQTEIKQLRQDLNQQLNECLSVLKELPDGEGLLYKTTMSVNDLGKIDVYQYLYFIAMHIQRHLTQIQKNEREYDSLYL